MAANAFIKIDIVLYLTGYLTRIREENISDGQTALKIPNAEVQ